MSLVKKFTSVTMVQIVRKVVNIW